MYPLALLLFLSLSLPFLSPSSSFSFLLRDPPVHLPHPAYSSSRNSDLQQHPTASTHSSSGTQQRQFTAATAYTRSSSSLWAQPTAVPAHPDSRVQQFLTISFLFRSSSDRPFAPATDSRTPTGDDPPATPSCRTRMEDVKHQWDPLQSPSFRPRGNFEHRGGAISEDARRRGGRLPEGGGKCSAQHYKAGTHPH